MKKTILLCFILALAWAQICATETATEAVQHMRFGWNLGNSLDANSGDTTNMWIEHWTQRQPSAYETAWSQPVTTRALIHMMKEAGIGVIRVPVTWYPHMGVTLNSQYVWEKSLWQPQPVDSVWMARVQEVVDYVIDEGMYCILNVHHDTGTSNTAWITASMANFQRTDSLYRALWTQIATRFRDYDEHLVFEGYNEMTDAYDSWCFASMGTASNYNAQVAADAYQAINSYANAFVQAVRATGGNNADRNLMVNTYAACSGHGTWSSHLTDPLTQLTVPTDPCGNQDHLMISVHSYPSLKNNGSYMSQAAMQQTVQQQVNVINTYLIEGKNMPVVIGEWGTADGNDDYEANPTLYLQFVNEMITRCMTAGICPLYWMGLSDGTHRSVPELNQPDIVNTMVSAVATGLNGVRTDNADRKVMVVDGKVLLLRDGHMYTVTGALVK